MSKRSRKEFETEHYPAATTTDAKRKTKRRKSANALLSNSSHIECSVCWEDFHGSIYQCSEGHLFCFGCCSKFKLCPTCNVPLSTNIRNRILEQLLSTKPDRHTRSTKKQTPIKLHCKLCHTSFTSEEQRTNHLHECEMRKMQCPFMECEWVDCFHKFAQHAQTQHFTLNGSVQPIQTLQNKPTVYAFNHAIKFPKDTLTRKSADFLWPKIIEFEDGKKFFVLSRFKGGYITVYVRLMALSKLSDTDIDTLKSIAVTQGDALVKMGAEREDEIVGEYWIEFRIKDKVKKERKENEMNGTPLRWPGDLYAISLPFNTEKRMTQILNVHQSIFTKYWVQQNLQSSAVLRFQFQAVLK